VASLTTYPKVRDDLVIIRQVIRGEVVYVCKIPETKSYQKVGELQHDLMGLLDGTRSPEEIVEVRASSKSPYGNIFYLALPAWNPEKYFDWLLPRIRFIWTPGFVLFSAGCILVMLGIWVQEWQTMLDGTIALFTFEGQTATDILELLIILFIVGFLHESAHGLTCRYFGGSVTQMGFMLVYFTPCFYVDVSDTYLFDRHYKTQWVIYAGCYLELFICALSTFVWALTSDGTFINDIAYKFLLMTGISSIVMNLDPLIKLDGYYSLMDYLEIPDLWERSFEYQRGWIKKTIFRLPVELEPVTRRLRRIFLTYSTLSVVYKAVLIAVFLWFMRNIFVSQFGGAGYALLGLAILLMFRKYILNLWNFLKFNLLDKREVLMSPRTLMITGAVSVVLLAGATLPSLPVSVQGDFALEPRSAGIVRASEGGIVERILVREGQQVGADEVLAVLRNEELEWKLRSRRISSDLIAHELAAAMQRGEAATLAKKESEREQLLDTIRVLEQRVDALTLRSPSVGLVMTPRLKDWIGSFIRVGEIFCEVSGSSGLIARVPIRDSRLEEIQPGQKVDLLFASYPYKEFRGEVLALAPASKWLETNGEGIPEEEGNLESDYANFEVIIGLVEAADRLREGMSGTARIDVGRSTVVGRAARAIRRWFGSRIW
jgi:putative peptide zinc metalloprotease protein